MRRWGIRYTLLIGLNLQFVGLGMLFAWQDSWTKTEAIIYVTVAQMLCGIAKDLTKLGDSPNFLVPRITSITHS